MILKLVTINTHSLIEENYPKKLKLCAEWIKENNPDIIAMQEVNQSEDAAYAENSDEIKLCGKLAVKEDNHMLRLSEILHKNGADYYGVWLGIKNGYDKFEEGLAFMSRKPILKTEEFLVSRRDDYNDWKTRKMLGIKTGDGEFYNMHMGWWNDAEEPFSEQWERVSAHIKPNENIWLMGDFNSRSDIRGEGYDKILDSGWTDTYISASEKDNGFTVETKIDGWKDDEKTGNIYDEKMRIDYIWNGGKKKILKSEVIFNGTNGPVISDHYGIMITVWDGKEVNL